MGCLKIIGNQTDEDYSHREPGLTRVLDQIVVIEPALLVRFDCDKGSEFHNFFLSLPVIIT